MIIFNIYLNEKIKITRALARQFGYTYYSWLHHPISHIIFCFEIWNMKLKWYVIIEKGEKFKNYKDKKKRV